MLEMLRDPNPLFVKSVRSRMRLAHMLSWGVVTLTLTTFVSLLIFFVQTKQFDVNPHDAAKAVIPGVLIIQAVLLMFFGTGAVAYGIAEERDEKLVDYQRMTPMSPTQKILGYLFGLPAREYVLVALTMPFVIVAALYSGFSILTLLHFYIVFLSSTLVYHMTGLTTGMVWPRPRFAVFLSMGMVLVLYSVLPNLSRIGLPVFEHLTIRPTLFGLIYNELPLDMRPPVEATGINSFRPIPWFNGSMHSTVYSLFVQGFLIAVMFSVLRRRWQRENSHLFSKSGAMIVFGGVVVFILSSIWAMVAQDEVYLRVFHPIDFREGVRATSSREPEMIMVLLFVSMALVGALYLLMTSWITSGRDTAIEGWRRARKHGDRRLSWNSDAASSLPACLAMIGMSVTAGVLVMMLATKYQGFFAGGPSMRGAAFAIVAIVGVGLFVQGACERLSGRVFSVAIFLIWMIPLFSAIIISAAFGEPEFGLLVAMPCPPAMLFTAISVMLDTTTPGAGQYPAFIPPEGDFANFVLITQIGVYGYLGAGLMAQAWRWKHRRRIRRFGMGTEVQSPHQTLTKDTGTATRENSAAEAATA